MTSGAWITWFMIMVVILFTLWEFAQLARRRAGNKSALTMSQYVSRKIKTSRKWLIGITIWALIVWGVMTWIVVFRHWDFVGEWIKIIKN